MGKGKPARILRDRLSSLEEDERAWILGRETDDPLGHAFATKRLVHPFIPGNMLPEPEAREAWHRLMQMQWVPEGSKRSAYIHIPFCQTKCLYCGFFQNFGDQLLEDDYVRCLVEDLRLSGREPLVRSGPFHAVYIGGGTPSILSADNIRCLMRAIRESLPLANDCEITFEARFYEFTREKIDACLEEAVNRFSLGVQSFDTDVRRRIGRVESREQILNRLAYIHGMDQAAVIVDLMFGMPGQSMEIWEKDLSTMAQAELDGGDLYQLNVFNKGPLKRAIEQGSLPAPSRTSEQAAMFERGVEFLSGKAFQRLSVCHWARNTRERNLYNFFAKSGAVTIPFGAGAAGKAFGHTFMLNRDVHQYIQEVGQGNKPLLFLMATHEKGRIFNEIVSQMDRGRLNVAWFRVKHDLDLPAILEPVFSAWVDRGLAGWNGEFLDLTLAGQFWYVNLTQSILDCLLMLENDEKPVLPVAGVSAQG
jgi:oxygen-independent coproporphyrinogen-3 oxidase